MDGELVRIVGNRDLLSRIQRDVMSDTLSHAYIIEGCHGSGKHTLAKYISLALACNHSPLNKLYTPDEISMFDILDAGNTSNSGIPSVPCCFDDQNKNLCRSCQKVLAGNCPDIYVVGRDGRSTIGVESIRNLKESIYLAPIDIETKIYIIEDAETMTVQAQNALLLTLEEPPLYVLFLLLCESAEGLLETIRSRAPRLRTELLADTDIRNYLIAESKEAKSLLDTSTAEFNTIVLSADGCIGRALELLDPKERTHIIQRRATTDAFIECAAHRQAVKTLETISMFGTKRDEASEILEYIKTALRDLLLIKKSETVSLKYYTDRKKAFDISDSLSSEYIITLLDAVANASYSFEKNGNVRLTLTRMCINAGLM